MTEDTLDPSKYDTSIPAPYFMQPVAKTTEELDPLAGAIAAPAIEANATAAPPAQPASSASAPPVVTSGGVNSYNVGNVRPPGSGTGFQQPATLDDGVAIAVHNVQSYPGVFNGGKPMTLAQIGSHWAPINSSDDPGGLNKNWVPNVTKFSGLDPNKPLDLRDPDTLLALVRGMHGAEHGVQLDPSAYKAGIEKGMNGGAILFTNNPPQGGSMMAKVAADGTDTGSTPAEPGAGTAAPTATAEKPKEKSTVEKLAEDLKKNADDFSKSTQPKDGLSLMGPARLSTADAEDRVNRQQSGFRGQG